MYKYIYTFVYIFSPALQSFVCDISSFKLAGLELWICCDGRIQFHVSFHMDNTFLLLIWPPQP